MNLPGYSMIPAFLQMLTDAAGLWPDEGPDSAFDLLISGMAGVAAAVAVAIALTVYFQTGYRSLRDMVRHGVAATLELALRALRPTTCAMPRSLISASRRRSPRPRSSFDGRRPQKLCSPKLRPSGRVAKAERRTAQR